jgi:hypothetical protein
MIHGMTFVARSVPLSGFTVLFALARLDTASRLRDALPDIRSIVDATCTSRAGGAPAKAWLLLGWGSVA